MQLLLSGCPKTRVGYSQHTNTAVKTCIIGTNLCAEAVIIASFRIPTEQFPDASSFHDKEVLIVTFLQMRCFLSLAKTRKMSAAAAAMDLSLSTFSKYISRMEDELTVKLFYKNHQDLTLTREGNLIYPSIEYMVKQYDDQFMEIYKHTSLYESTVNIVLTQHQLQIVQKLIGFIEAEPKVRLELKESSANDVCTMLDSGVADVGIIYEQLLDKKYPVITPLRQDRLVAVVSEKHPLAMRGTVSVNDLRNDTFYLYKGDHLMHQYLLRVCIEAGFAPKEDHSDLRLSTILLNVAAGTGVSLLSEYMVEAVGVSGNKLLHLKEEPQLTLCAICATEYPVEIIWKLIRFLHPVE